MISRSILRRSEVMSVTVRAHRQQARDDTVRRIILIRNGESSANVDLSQYCTVADWRIPLTPRGCEESTSAGHNLAQLLGHEPVYFYFSPYIRSKETLKHLLEGAAKVSKLNIIGVREDVRLRDGDIGRYESTEDLRRCLREREEYGKFFYRFPHGESGADVCDRITSFLDAFQREKVAFAPNTNVVVLTHGLTIRMFVKRWFHLNVETFQMMTSPPTSAAVELEQQTNGNFKLNSDSLTMLNLPPSLAGLDGYAFRNKKLLGSLSTGAPYM
jgi:broad specificity phosphatase PhoE